MSFAIVCIAALAVLGAVAAIASLVQGGSDDITTGHDCASCTSATDGSCQLHCLMEKQRAGEGTSEMEKKQREGNKPDHSEVTLSKGEEETNA